MFFVPIPLSVINIIIVGIDISKTASSNLNIGPNVTCLLYGFTNFNKYFKIYPPICNVLLNILKISFIIITKTYLYKKYIICIDAIYFLYIRRWIKNGY